MLILASQSASRTAMLSAAGVPFTAEPAHADEAALKAAMAGAHPREVADALERAVSSFVTAGGRVCAGVDIFEDDRVQVR